MKITASNWKSKNCTSKGRKNQWTVADLKQYARDHKLKVSGNKAELCQRVDEHIKNSRNPKPGALARAKRGKPLPQPRQRPKRKGTKKLPALPKPKPKDQRIPLIEWSRFAKKQKMNEWTVLCIPKGTLFAHGTVGDFPDKVVPRGPGYFASLKTASSYAFERISEVIDDEKEDEPPIYPGKVIVVETKKDICVLDMTNKDNIRRLLDIGGVGIMYAMNFAFNTEMTDEVCRESSIDEDNFVSNWLCEQGIHGIVGWGIGTNEMRTCPLHEKDLTRIWHDEIVVCEPSKYLKRHPLELRQIYLPSDDKSLLQEIEKNWPGIDKHFKKEQNYIVATWNGCAFQKYIASGRRNPQKINIGKNKNISSRIDYSWDDAWNWISDSLLSTRNDRDKWLFNPKARKL